MDNRKDGGPFPEDAYPLRQLTKKIIAAAIAVHRELGPGYLESVYENALQYELRKRGHSVASQVVYTVFYDDVKVGEHRCDLLIDNEIIIELKATEKKPRVYVAQLISTLKAAGRRVGLLINFGMATLVDGVERVVLTK